MGTWDKIKGSVGGYVGGALHNPLAATLGLFTGKKDKFGKGLVKGHLGGSAMDLAGLGAVSLIPGASTPVTAGSTSAMTASASSGGLGAKTALLDALSGLSKGSDTVAQQLQNKPRYSEYFSKRPLQMVYTNLLTRRL